MVVGVRAVGSVHPTDSLRLRLKSPRSEYPLVSEHWTGRQHLLGANSRRYVRPVFSGYRLHQQQIGSIRPCVKGDTKRYGAWTSDRGDTEMMGSLARVGCLLVCVLVLQQGLEVPAAYAEDSTMSSYEKRKLENEKRKELLRSLREKAEQGASRVDVAPAPAYTPSAAPTVPTVPKISPQITVPKDAITKNEDGDRSSFSMPKMDMPKMDIPKMDMPKMDMPKMDMPKLPSFSFGGDGNRGDVSPAPKPVPPPVAPAPAPKPVPPPVAPAPAPKPVPPPVAPVAPPVTKFSPPRVAMPESIPKTKSSQSDTLEQWRQQQKKDLATRKKLEKQADVQKKARKGSLPVWLVEFLLIGSLVGFAFASVVFGDQISALYKRVDRMLTNLFSTK